MLELVRRSARHALCNAAENSGGVTDTNSKRRLAIVLWSGAVGGAEVHSVALANQMRRMGVEVTLVYIEHPGAFAARLLEEDIPYRTLGFGRGREVLLHPRRYAAEVGRAGPDGALLTTCGFMGAALRAGVTASRSLQSSTVRY